MQTADDCVWAAMHRTRVTSVTFRGRPRMREAAIPTPSVIAAETTAGVRH